LAGRIICGSTEFLAEAFLIKTGKIDFKYELIGVIERAFKSRLERIGLL
jgi:hypothetical protein